VSARALPVAFVALVAVGGLVLYTTRRSTSSSSSDPAAPIGAGGLGGVLEEIVVTARSIVTRHWTPPASAARWLPHIAAAEGQHAIPDMLLARLIYQESRFRADVIDGTVRGGGKKQGDPGWDTAARGIAQIVPKWHPGVDPLDPVASIYYAANYLAQLKRQFGGWEKALASYNWGPGNVTVASSQNGEQWLAVAPLETRRYVLEITADVPVQVA
jgi:soluble lytic murein transglycosylase-like protein